MKSVVGFEDGFLWIRDLDTGELQAWRPDPEGEFHWNWGRFTFDHLASKEEELKHDPIGALAQALELTECPYHPGVWIKPGEPCPVCQEEAVQQHLKEGRDAGVRVP